MGLNMLIVTTSLDCMHLCNRLPTYNIVGFLEGCGSLVPAPHPAFHHTVQKCLLS